MILHVESTPGPNGDPEPHAFMLGSQRLEVDRIIDRWPSPGFSYFKVQASDGSTYILRYDAPLLQWQLTLFQANPPPESPH